MDEPTHFSYNVDQTLNSSYDPDLNFFNQHSSNTLTLSVTESKDLLSVSENDFSLLNINIRSLSKNFENLKNLLNDLCFSFKIICVTETWH